MRIIRNLTICLLLVLGISIITIRCSKNSVKQPEENKLTSMQSTIAKKLVSDGVLQSYSFSPGEATSKPSEKVYQNGTLMKTTTLCTSVASFTLTNYAVKYFSSG